MRDVTWRMGVTMAVLAILAALGLNASCSAGPLAEWMLVDTPQAQISSYLEAVAQGHRQRALDHWSLDGAASPVLEARRESLTEQLLAYGPHLEYQVLEVEWWRTLHDPGVTEDSAEAGAARLRVVVTGDSQPLQVYLFDLVLREPPATAAAAAGRPRWTVIDVYPEGSTPLAWPWR